MVHGGVPQAWAHHQMPPVHLIRVRRGGAVSFTLNAMRQLLLYGFGPDADFEGRLVGALERLLKRLRAQIELGQPADVVVVEHHVRATLTEDAQDLQARGLAYVADTRLVRDPDNDDLRTAHRPHAARQHI